MLLDTIPEKYDSIVFYATIYQGHSRKQVFSNVQNAFIRAVDANNVELAKYSISGDKSASGMCSLVFAKAIRNGNTWDFETLGNVYKTDDLMDIASMFKNSSVNELPIQENIEQPRKKIFGIF